MKGSFIDLKKDYKIYLQSVMSNYQSTVNPLITSNVRKRANIRNRYSQAPHLTKDTNGNVTTSQLNITNESQVI